jgi:dienelactone hydrolase
MSNKQWIVWSIFLVAVASLAASARPAVTTKQVQFLHGTTPIQGVIAWNEQFKGRRPGVIIVHGGWGYSDNVRDQARRIAESGYVGYSFDMSGQGPVATHVEHSFSGAIDNNSAKAATRFNLALEQLRADPHVDPGKISAIGYCWGGAVVLNMARAGAKLDAVVTIAGVLDTQTPAVKGDVVSRILVLQGALDPIAPAQKIEALRKELTDAGVKFDIVVYPGVRHAFTQPYAKVVNSESIAYDANADRASWDALLKLFSEVYR